ncbi:MAG: prolipoprotein diacylglyceryl transferase [Herpetosiphon sp.]
MHPPTGPYLIDHALGFLSIRWYAVCILSGAVLAAWFGARRAAAVGRDPEHAWNLLSVGLVVAIIAARAWYVLFEWPNRFRPEWEAFLAAPSTNWSSLIRIINPATGGIAIQGGLAGALLAGYWYVRRHRLSFWEWADIAAPCFPIGQALGRWGNFFNQEAYGRPTTLPWGLKLTDQGCSPGDANCHRLPPFDNLSRWPATTRFHPTFLYESLWSVGVLMGLLIIERRFRRHLRQGDMLLWYGILYSIGRFWVEGLRVDSLCTGGLGGECVGGQLRTAQVVSVATVAVCGVILLLRHRRAAVPPPVAPAAA